MTKLYRMQAWAKSHVALMAMVVSFALVGSIMTWFSFAATPSNTTVDFSTTTVTLPPDPIGTDVSTYGSNNITASSAQVNALKTLGVGMIKIPIQYNNGSPVSSAGGGPKNISGSAWITAAKATGAIPEIVVGGTSDDNFTSTDAANLVKYFNTPDTSTYNPVAYWAIGNEPNGAGLSTSAYCTLFNAAAIAMKAVDPTIKIDGPTFSFYSQSSMQQFLTCVGNNVDVLDFHAYGTGNNPLSSTTLLSETGTDEQYLKQLRQMINTTDPSRASQIQMQVGEYNMSYVYGDGYTGGWDGSGNDSRMLEPFNTVWSASTLGGILEAGGRAMQYGDLNGGLGLTFDGSLNAATGTHYNMTVANSSPMPVYHGIGMFTGESLFHGFGTNVVSSSTTLPNVDVFASSNSDNIVLVNKNPSTTENAVISLAGFSGGSADVWQTNSTNPLVAPTKISTITNVTNSMSVSLPAYTVTTIVLNGGSTTTTTSTPVVSSVENSTPSTTGTTITWTTDEASTTQVQYGTSPAYSSTTTEDASMVTAHNVPLSGLNPGTTYHYRVISANSNNQTTTSGDYTFTTAVATTTPTPPAISGVATNNVSTSTVTVNWTTDEASTTQVQYGTTAAYGSTTLLGASLVTTHSINLSSFAAATTYHYRVISVNSTGQSTTSGDYTFTTAVATTTPTPPPVTATTHAITGIDGKCIDDEHSSFVNKNTVWLYACNGTNAQQWTVSSGGTIGIDSGKYCIDAKNTKVTAGTLVWLNACTGSSATKWQVKSNGSIVNPQSGLCLDDVHSGTKNGNPLQLYTCNGTSAQKWSVK